MQLLKRKLSHNLSQYLQAVCLPVNLYFYHLAGKEGLPKIYEKTGETGKDQSTLLLILGFLFPMVAAMIVQGDINKLYK